jgi:hypothetical protein
MSALLTTLAHIGGACVAAGLVTSCSSASEPIATSLSHLAPTPIAPATTSDGHKLIVAVYTTPTQPPPAGVDGIVLVITDATTGAPVEGLNLAVTPWMPAMGHGSCCTPEFTDMGKGHYVATDASLVMQGEWQLRTKISGKVDDTVAPTFDIP